MIKNKLVHTLLASALVLGTISCKDQLDVGNPNNPTVAANVTSEAGIASLAQGGIYYNGFNIGDGWLGNSFFSLPLGYNELIADNVGASASNNQVTTVGQPDYIIINGVKQINTSPSIGILRTYNTRASTGASNNAIYYMWLNMYAMNMTCNQVLSLVDGLKMTDSKKATVKAWCYWWKGYAYSMIGTRYYYGLIVNDFAKTNNNYITHDLIIAESDRYFKLTTTTLATITTPADYTAMMGELIPSHIQVGLGKVPTVGQWNANINTMLARNIYANKLAPFVNGNPAATIAKSSTSVMTAADWTAIKNYCLAGVAIGDNIFTGRTFGTNDFFSATGGSVASLASGKNNQTTFKLSERAYAAFKTGDKRIDQNFNDSTTYSNDYVYTSTHNVVNKGVENKNFPGTILPNVWIYANKDVGAYELELAASYEENATMYAEALMRTGDIAGGLTQIDNVRKYMGAGITTPSTTDLATALNEVVIERRASLLFRGLYVYDLRRWGWTYDIANGGGAYNQPVVQGTNHYSATINYNFLDYWDVPANEVELNPDPTGAKVLKNPNF